ncbi:MAG: hypothetical protein NVS1B7_5900 [Candidatus Saccharimonadales bacterium]
MIKLKLKNKQSTVNISRRHPNLEAPMAPVFSYRANRSRSEDSMERNKIVTVSTFAHTWLINVPTFAALAVIFSSLIYGVTLSNSPRIQLFGESQPVIELRDKQEYVNAGSRLIDQSLLNYIKPTIDTAHIAAEFQKQFPEVSKVSIGVPLVDRKPVFQVLLATPKLILNTTKGSYIISDSGRVLVAATDIPKNTLLSITTVQDESGLQIRSGDRAMTADNVKFIQTFKAELQAKGIVIQSLILPQSPEELDVKLPNVPYYLKLNFLNDARQQAGTYIAVSQSLLKGNIMPSQYIDLRVEEHAYYK